MEVRKVYNFEPPTSKEGIHMNYRWVIYARVGISVLLVSLLYVIQCCTIFSFEYKVLSVTLLCFNVFFFFFVHTLF